MRIYSIIGNLLPKRVLSLVKEEVEYAGINVEEKKFLGFLIIFSAGLALLGALSFYTIMKFPVLETFLILFIIILALIYYWVNSIAESKGAFVEKILPDALQLIASNIKAGMTTERALFASARPEFGPLSEELKLSSKKVASGIPLEIALADIPKNIKSKILDRTMWLLTEGIKNGGQIAELLLRLSDDLRAENSLKEEVGANINMYVIMIMASAAVGSPLLLAISTFIVQIIGTQTASLTITPEQISELGANSPVGGFIGVPEVSITAGFIMIFAVVLMFVTSVFSSLIIGIIMNGKEKFGIKYIPIIFLLNIGLFFITRDVLSSVLGSTLGI